MDYQAKTAAELTIVAPVRVYVCLDCGRYSRDKLGKHTPGWTVGCAKKSVRFQVTDLKIVGGLVQAISKNAVVGKVQSVLN